MTPLIMAVPVVAAIWAATAVQTYSLATRRSRKAVRRAALRARVTLLTGTAVGLTVAVVSAPRALLAVPLLALPAAIVAWRTLPRLGGLAGALRTDPWGPSDPGTRRAAADPDLTVPPFAALTCTIAALVALTGGWVAAVVAYAIAGAATAALAWRAPHRRETVTRAGMLRRVVVRPATPPATGREAA